jgi:hypothetical protein
LVVADPVNDPVDVACLCPVVEILVVGG